MTDDECNKTIPVKKSENMFYPGENKTKKGAENKWNVII
jgi:hypothetical protein